jgi:glycosyltransferase involved in cell wall biosynthesis
VAKSIDFNNTPASKRRNAIPYATREGADLRIAISIVTPFYNPGAIFAETVISVRRQSWQLWEWIIVDDGSTDKISIAALSSAQRNEPRIRTIKLPVNLGLSAARNRGLREALGDYVCWLDADDLIEPTFLEKCLWLLQTKPHFAFANGYTIGFGADHYVWHHGFHDREIFLRENRVNPTSVIRTSVARAIGGFDESLRTGLEDWDFWLRAADHGYWGDTIEEPLIWYRRRRAHLKEWKNLQINPGREALETQIRGRYPKLWTGGFPERKRTVPIPRIFDASIYLGNPLSKTSARALFIVPHLELGGADRFNLDLVEQLSRRFNWEISVVTTRKSHDPWQREFYELTSDVFMLHRFMPFEWYPAFLAYFIESRQPDVVYVSHSELGYRLLPWLKEAFPTLPIVDLVHIAADDWKDGGYPRFSCQARPWLIRTIATSQILRQWLVRNGANRESVELVYTGVDSARWNRSTDMADTARRRWNIPKDCAVILYAARFAKQKEPHLLPEIVQQLEKRGRRFMLLLAGDGPERSWLEEHLCHKYARSVMMLGAIDPDEVRMVMSASDLLLLPSRSEGIALVLFEAMSMGVVPVATDVGGQGELLTSDCGVLVPFDGRLVDAIVESLDGLMTNEQFRRRLAKAGRERVVAQFRLEQTGAQINGIFRAVMRKTSEPLKAQLTAVDKRVIASELAELRADNLEVDAWNRQLREGRRLLLLMSGLAGLIRRSPMRRWFRRFELRYGERIGRWILGHR